MRTVLWLALIAGCSKTDPLYCDNAGKGTAMCGDAGTSPDTSFDAVDQNCFGKPGSSFEVCLGAMATSPTNNLTLPITIDTDSDPDCLIPSRQPAGWTGARDACIVVAQTIVSNSGATDVTGGRPLVLLATNTIMITQPLNAQSHRAASHGPNANSTMCTGGTAGATLGTVGGGGGGGSFQTAGADGGTGGASTAPVAAGMHGDPGAPTQLRGGCPGTVGGGPAGSGSIAGAGGGAVYLLAGGAITITSTINASGAGGTGGTNQAGGAGGGSGGMIAIFGQSIDATSSALIFANGGGGASGGDGANMPGNNGEDPSAPATQAAGGTIGGGNGFGGKGYAGGLPAGAGTSVNGATKCGGGGGGGGGFLLANHGLGGAVSPPPRDF